MFHRVLPTGLCAMPHDAFAAADARARLATTLLGCLALLGLAALWYGAAQLLLLKKVQMGLPVTPESAIAADRRAIVIGLLQLLLLLATFAAFAHWKHQAYANLQHLRHAPRYRTAWATACYFIPVVNLVRPYRIMKELWYGSLPAVPDAKQASHGAMLRLLASWWVLWLASLVTVPLAFRASLAAETAESYIRLTWLTLGSDAVGVASAVAALLLVQRVNACQQQKRATLHQAQPEPAYPAPLQPRRALKSASRAPGHRVAAP